MRGAAHQTAAAPAGADAPPLSSPAKRGASSGARIGKYDGPLTQLVVRRPGVTVAEAAAELGVAATALYPVIRRLEATGTLVKRGRGLHPAA